MGRCARAEHTVAALVAVDLLRNHCLVGWLLDRLSVLAIADDGESLYVVNYNSSTVAKVRTSDMTVLQTEGVGYHPIGITHDAQTRQVWVATYGGTLAVFQDGSPG